MYRCERKKSEQKRERRERIEGLIEERQRGTLEFEWTHKENKS